MMKLIHELNKRRLGIVKEQKTSSVDLKSLMFTTHTSLVLTPLIKQLSVCGELQAEAGVEGIHPHLPVRLGYHRLSTEAVQYRWISTHITLWHEPTPETSTDFYYSAQTASQR